MQLTRINTFELATARASKRWQPVAKIVEDYLSLEAPPIPEDVPQWDGWQYHDGNRWYQLKAIEALPKICTLDFEAEKDQDGVYRPTCCSLLGPDGWYWWQKPLGQTPHVIPFPPKRIVLGHAVVYYDRRYLSAEYEYTKPSIIYICTLGLANIIGGTSSDDSMIRTLWNAFDKKAKSGKAVPKWYENCGPVSLKFLALRYLGREMTKEIRDDWIEDPTSVSPKDLYTYCMGDTDTTFDLARVLYWKVKNEFVNNDITWWGMATIATSRYYLREWSEFYETNQKKYEDVLDRLRALQDKLVTNALDSGPDKYSMEGLDWKILSKGKNKGKPKWYTPFQKATGVFSSSAPHAFLKLHWNGEPVILRSAGRGKPNWWAGGVPLPHPAGEDHSSAVGSPLTIDFEAFAKSGALTSKVLSQEQLIKVFGLLRLTSQWKAYRTRYLETYRQPVETGLEVSVADLNPTHTISRRSGSNKWVVLPKPKYHPKGSENLVIGSDVLGRIGCPKGYKIVSADFVSQESRIAVGPLTDARVSEHCSSEWSRAILMGDKSKKTDGHSIVAGWMGMDRQDGKTINFSLQYMGGQKTVSNKTRLILGCDKRTADMLASQLIENLRGRNGIARTTFNNLKYVAEVPNGYSYLLRVKQPNSVNPQYLPNRRDFFTLRGNLPIQGAGVDEKHLLAFIISEYAREANVSATFACDVHDRLAYFCPDGDAEKLAKIFDIALGDFMHISYECAAHFWDTFDPKPEPRKVLKPLPHWCKFDKVYIADNLLEK